MTYVDRVSLRGVRAGLSFGALTVGPIVGAAVSTILGLLAGVSPTHAAGLRIAAIVVAAVVLVLLVLKAVRDYRHQINVADARYAALKELHNRLGPALDIATEIALLDPAEIDARHQRLRSVAGQCCAAVVAMTPSAIDVRAAVFEVRPGDPDEVAPIAWFGRRDSPRTFRGDSQEGAEVLSYLSSPHPVSERYTDTAQRAPAHYQGDTDRYRTFIRVPIYANNVVFGMLTVDAPKPGALTVGDELLAELIASQTAVAFAIAAE